MKRVGAGGKKSRPGDRETSKPRPLGQTQRIWVAKGPEEGQRRTDPTLHSRSPLSNGVSALCQAPGGLWSREPSPFAQINRFSSSMCD